MNIFNRFLCSALVLLSGISVSFLTEKASANATSRCQLEERDVPAAATGLIAALRKKGRALNTVMPIQLMSSVEGDGEALQKNIVFEGFLRPEKGFRRVVPGLGVGVEITNKTLLYACLDLQPDNAHNQLTILFLEAPGMQGGWRSSQAAFATSNVQLRPLNEITHVLGQIPLIGRIFDAVPVDAGLHFLQDRVYDLVNILGGIGIKKIIVTPTKVTFETSGEIAKVKDFHVTTQTIPMKSEWMMSTPPVYQGDSFR